MRYTNQIKHRCYQPEELQKNDQMWELMARAMVLHRSGKFKHSLRVVVLAEELRDGAKVLVEVLLLHVNPKDVAVPNM